MIIDIPGGPMNQLTDAPSARYPLEYSVEYRHNYARAAKNGVIKNLSLTGAFIENSSHPFKEKDKIKVTIRLSDRVRHISAKVIWTNEKGAGVKFQHFNNQDLQLIDDLIYFAENKINERRSVLDNIFSFVVDDEKKDAA